MDRSFGLNGLITLNTNVLGPVLPFNSSAHPYAVEFQRINGLALTSDGNLIVGGINLIEQGFLAKLQPTTLHAVPDDYDGDGVSDLAVDYTNGPNFIYRPSSGGADVGQPFGVVGVGKTLPAPGDYSGSGVTNVAGFLPETGLYAYRPTKPVSDVTGGFRVSDSRTVTPAPGDYNGDGKTDMTVFDSSTASFSMAISTANSFRYAMIRFGQPGAGNSIPAPGDYDGDGKTDLAVFLPNFGVLAYRPSGGGKDVLIAFGHAGLGNSIPTPGDYDGDGVTDISVYIPKLAIHAYRPSSGGDDVLTYFGVAGVGGSIPTPGDYDGDGKTDISVYIPTYSQFPTDSRFAYRPSGGGGDVIRLFGFASAGQIVPAAALPVALGTTATSAGSNARDVSSAVDIPLTVDLTNPTAKKKPTGTA